MYCSGSQRWINSPKQRFPLERGSTSSVSDQTTLWIRRLSLKFCHQSIYICKTQIDNCYPVHVLIFLLGRAKFNVRLALYTCNIRCLGKEFGKTQDIVQFASKTK